MKIYDSHTHLNDDDFYDDVTAWLNRAQHLGVVEMNMVGSNEKLNERALRLAHDYPQLHAIIGWHPEDSRNFGPQQREQLIKDLKRPEVVSLGEIGLDYHWDSSPRDVQQRVFADQLAIARRMHLPISVHCRDALADTYSLLKQAHVEDFGGVMHSFNGDTVWLHRFLELGMQVSYSGVATFHNAADVQAAVKETPLDRLLVETDAPYLTPEPYRGQRNEPAYSRYVVEGVAKLKGCSSEEVAAASFRNARELFPVREQYEED